MADGSRFEDRLLSSPDGPGRSSSSNGGTGLPQAAPRRDFRQFAWDLHAALISTLDVDRLRTATLPEQRQLVEDSAGALLTSRGDVLYGEDRRQVISLVADEVLGLGPIQPLLDDPSVSEVMVNGANTIYLERDGVLQLTDLRFRDEDHVRRIAERILSRIGRRVDEGTPMVDARLEDGSRVNITIPPATPSYTTISIRKFRTDRLTISDLRAAGSLTEPMIGFLAACVKHRLNILISGGTGSGKTTLLNALSAFIPDTERIITIEDPVEMVLQQRHVINMEARPPDMTGGHAITQRELLRNALRMRPDRIIVGEVRGPEALDMLQAMNTGHEGSLSTVHANSPRDALARIENMVLMGGIELPVVAIREQLASALHLVLQIHRFPDGMRRVVKVSEVTGMEGSTVTMHDIFAFHMEGVGEDGKTVGTFRPTGLRPTFSEELAAAGHRLEPSIFYQDALR
jgi:pilus assembly protein CpaF